MYGDAREKPPADAVARGEHAGHPRVILGAVGRSEEVLLALSEARDKILPATHIRSTLLLSSVQSLRSRGLFDQYVQHLDPAVREAIITSVAGLWLPMNLGVLHYRACEALRLSLVQAAAIGHDVGNRIQGSFLGVVVRAARGSGVTPWTILAQCGRLFDRTFQGGGGVSVHKLGPKEARVELVGLPVLAIPYFRHAYRGAFSAGLELFSEKVYVLEAAKKLGEMDCAYKISWV